jgi:hypothetical protein
MKMLREVKWLRHATDKSCTTPLPDFYLLLTYTDTLSNKTPMSTTPRFFLSLISVLSGVKLKKTTKKH